MGFKITCEALQKQPNTLVIFSLYSWTWYDAVSLFAGHGKLRAMKSEIQDLKILEAFALPGKVWTLCNEILSTVQEFAVLTAIYLRLLSCDIQMFYCKRSESESENYSLWKLVAATNTSCILSGKKAL